MDGRVVGVAGVGIGAAAAVCCARAFSRQGQQRAAPVALSPQIEDLHRVACNAGEETYTDPATGFTVFTRVAHLRRGHCCGSGCRHCPYDHMNTPANIKKREAEMAALGELPEPSSGLKKASVYTRTGDKGTSALFTGERRSKDDLVFEALGAVDEVMAHVGVAREHLRNLGVMAHEERLEEIQVRLLDAGSHIATPRDNCSATKLALTTFTDDHVRGIEQWIDQLNADLPKLRSFIVPTGGLASCHFHVARTVCRRAERNVVRLSAKQSVDPCVQKYLNRLSDLFFMLARTSASHEGRSDVLRPRRGPRV
eukprot:TRINITY_DN15452_c0_g1_i1.p2 TRINITY_DN15452_c0_g1~~TRINITY_DN15452_c0_g1_i1.p2  ORF type:complete len:331 (+),score=93.79 TRINITY_DN15452_c0_g1_i1:61-993(+)